MSRNRILIIGAGPAGLVCGKHLLNNGFDVTIIERSVFPRLSVGESLLPISMEHFDEVGFTEDLSKIDWCIKRGATFTKKDRIFEVDFARQYTENARTWTWQVIRSEFDNIMANNFLSAGGKIEFGSNITNLNLNDGVKSCSYTKGKENVEIQFDFLVDSSGFGGIVSQFTNKEYDRAFLDHRSIFTHMNFDIEKHGERIYFDILDQELWLWVIPFHNNTASVGVVGINAHFDKNDDLKTVLDKNIQKSDRFKAILSSENCLFDPVDYNGYSQKSQDLYGENYCLIGNCAEFLDPIFSSGVAFATGSGLKAANTIIDHFKGNGDWGSFEAYMRRGVDTFKDYVQSWYDGDLQTIFFSNSAAKSDEIINKVTSVLAGYVWDETNSFVCNSEKNLKKVAKFLESMEKSKIANQ